MQLVRTAQSKHKINLLALSTEDGGPYVVATWHVVLIVCISCVPLNPNTNTPSHSPRRTGGPHGGRGAPRPPRPEPLLIVLTTPLSRLFRHQDTKAMRWLDWMWSFAAKLRGTRVRNRLAPPCHCRCPFSTHTHTHADPPLGGSMRMT